MAATLLLDVDAWDITLDANGNLAVASEPYAQLQDVASECRTFAGECWYNTTIGIPYFGEILGENTPIPALKEYLVLAAKRVPGITDATVYITSIADRSVSGQIQTNAGIATV